MDNRTAAAVVHGWVAATLVALPGNKNKEKRNELYDNAKQFARDYLDGKEVDGYFLDDMVEGTSQLIKEEIEDQSGVQKYCDIERRQLKVWRG